MSPELENEYKRLLEDAEAHFAARVRWSEDRRISVGDVLDFPEQFLMRLYAIRTREACELPRSRAMHA